MKFFSAETPGDYPISTLDPDARLLLSPTTYPPTFAYPFPPPAAVMVDSGAFHHGHRNSRRGRLRTLVDQLRIADQFPQADVTLAHCDVLHREGMDHRLVIDETLRNAEWFMQQDLPARFHRLLVAQARDPDELYLVVSRLQEFGPEVIGIGGMVKYLRADRRVVPRMIEAAREAAGPIPLHAFGVTAPHLLERLRQMGIQRCDSATVIRNAVFGSVVYSRPYRRFRLVSEHSSRPEQRQKTTYYHALKNPLPCHCPVCREDPAQLQGSTPEAKYCRTIHNYYHVKLEVQGEGTWQAAYSSAEFQSVITTLRSSLRSLKGRAPLSSPS